MESQNAVACTGKFDKQRDAAYSEVDLQYSMNEKDAARYSSVGFLFCNIGKFVFFDLLIYNNLQIIQN